MGRNVAWMVVAAVLAGCGPHTAIPVVARLPLVAPKPTAHPHPTLLVKFKTAVATKDMASFQAMFGLKTVGHIDGLDVWVEEPTGDTPIVELIEAIQASPLVEYVELNGRVVAR